MVMTRTSEGNGILDHRLRDQLSNDFQACLDFQPTLVIDCAFVTRHMISTYGMNRYLSTNMNLMDQALELQTQPLVRRFIAISSGAAVPYLLDQTRDQNLDPYGFLKASYERKFTNLDGTLKENVVLLRPFSMSGRNCQTTGIYALYDLIEQSRSGTIKIKSEQLVYRRYTDVEDLLRVALMAPIGHEVIESGGELVEIGDLATMIVETLGSGARIERKFKSIGADNYYSNNVSWERVTGILGIQPKTLREQIRISAGD